ncbi:MAG TPA: SPOR domain-containing protein [Pseudomonas xinjiangensis]|uniref:SPOR domain-containing protein n=2 Tax=root TaxID=1 RepID=A0A7V1FSP0_9GAMM|nr:SPOR domain-containing protein [Halopseudomonas xinjiangensis]HEC49379.1 SPOR domain-containing protein [Halopseudomonas xinjiangensis]
MDERLKQRIIGALVLVVAAVVFLPMLLTGQDETARVEVQAPEPPQMDEREIEVAAPVELPEPEQVPEIPPLPLPEPTQPPEPEVASSAPAPIPEPAPEPTPVPATEPAAEIKDGWVIQLGSFSSAGNAEGLRETLRTQGYNAYTVSANVGGNAITRVYVGPVVDREGANRLRDELARRHDNKGLVVAYDTSTSAR